MVSDKFGIGAEVSYRSAGIEANWGQKNSNTGASYTQKAAIDHKALRIMPRFSLHLLENSDKVDLYLVAGIGYKWASTKVTYTPDSYSPGSTNGARVPIASRLGIGTRIFFTDNIGLNVEAGIGGPLISGGLSVKIAN